jgi:hypothetical protein
MPHPRPCVLRTYTYQNITEINEKNKREKRREQNKKGTFLVLVWVVAMLPREGGVVHATSLQESLRKGA